MTNDFQQTAVKLSQGPLGIIALFIILIHGFSSLVLGLGADIGEANRSVLVWFLVAFPAGVFVIFAWLVSTRYQNLYPPGAFRNEENFVSLRFGSAKIDKQAKGKRRTQKPETLGGAFKAEAIGQLYWLGHDLMWTADTLLRGGSSKEVLIGIEQALHHLILVGLENTPVEGHLQNLHHMVQASDTISSSLRNEYARQIGSIIDQIGATAEKVQGDFKIPPHWNRVRS